MGPAKKDPKVKGVQSAAVQAFLRRKEEELRRKGTMSLALFSQFYFVVGFFVLFVSLPMRIFFPLI